MLNTKMIQGLKSRNSSYYEWDDDGSRGTGRLAVKVYPSNSKSFVYRYFADNKAKFINLGRFPEITLAIARKQAKVHGAVLVEGKDPKKEILAAELAQQTLAQQEAKQGSLKELFAAHAKDKLLKGRRNSHKDKIEVEKEVYPFIDPNTKAKDVSTSDIVPVLAAIINRGAIVHSNRIRSTLHAAFQYGLYSDNDPMNYTNKKFGITTNPVTPIKKQTHAEKVGDHFLSIEEVKLLLHDMEYRHDDLDISWTIRNLVLLCLHSGGQRPYELWNCKISDIDWKEKTLTIREEICKSFRKHVVPLTNTAINILRRQIEQTSNKNSLYIFPQKTDPKRCIAEKTLAKALSRYIEKTDIRKFTPRDFRRTFKTLGGQIDISKHDRDYIQGHAMHDVSAKHYDRYDYLAEKRSGLLEWENYLINGSTDNVTNESTNNVIKIVNWEKEIWGKVTNK